MTNNASNPGGPNCVYLVPSYGWPAPDKIYAWPSSTKPQGVSLAGGKVDDQIEYTRSDLIAARPAPAIEPQGLGQSDTIDSFCLTLRRLVSDAYAERDRFSHIAATIRINALHNGATNAEVDAMLSGDVSFVGWIAAKVEALAARPAPHPAIPLGEVRLYLDLDGVMADFDAHYPAEFGQDHKSMADDDMWAKINAHPSYFEDMPLCPGAADFFAEIRHLKPIILTACPRTNYAHVAGQKRRWVHKHLGKELTVLPVMGGHNKHLFMHAPGDILIDDYDKNCAPWRKSGGFAILHTSFDATRAALAALAPFARKGE